MSIRIMSLVWERAPYREAVVMTLLALADWANDEGKCWPSIPLLAVKARQSERNVRYILRELEEEGLVTLVPGGGRYHPNHYQLNVAKLETLQTLQGFKKTLQPLQGSDNVTLQNATANPANCNLKPCKLQPASSDPSGDPPEIQPSAPAREDGEKIVAAPGGKEGSADAPPTLPAPPPPDYPADKLPRLLEWLGLAPDGAIWQASIGDAVPLDAASEASDAPPACDVCADTGMVVATDGTRHYVTPCPHDRAWVEAACASQGYTLVRRGEAPPEPHARAP